MSSSDLLFRIVGVQWRDNRCRLMYQRVVSNEIVGDVDELRISALTENAAVQFMHVEFKVDYDGTMTVGGEPVGTDDE